jgi:hypothetical protein
MKPNEPFTYLMLATFSVACYADGAIWSSGLVAGITGVWFVDWLLQNPMAANRPTEPRESGGDGRERASGPIGLSGEGKAKA